MLDFLKLAPLLDSIGVDSLKDLKDSEELVRSALQAFQTAAADFPAWSSMLDENRAWVLWPLLKPLAPLHSCVNVPALQSSRPGWTALGVDGSQIMPSHHEVSSCYLLNAGVARITYGGELPPLLKSEPRLYARPDDLYPLVDRRRVHIDELFVALERSLFEFGLLVDLAEEVLELDGISEARTVLAMVDGSLIPWSLEKMPRHYMEDYLTRLEVLMCRLRLKGIAVVGYVSHSRSADLINALRVTICPYALSHCQTNCGHLNEESFPCSAIWPLSDRVLYQSILKPGETSSVFESAASVVKLMPEADATCFAYFRNEMEVARLEFPRWVYQDRALYEFLLAGVKAQCEKGFGYPVVLAEAHHQAVIRGPEREQFFSLIAQRLLSLGARTAVSPKEANKRRGFI
ncbi:MAG: DNA double-strand break repair nuclease NurA [Candidatus Melainabacteria bacterium]|nr:DNA double-strand break repair nuclease NurA [Candidatus Melainabacteria bacterium]